MRFRLLFILYIDYYESKSSQKSAQSPVPDIVSFIQHRLQEIGSCFWYCTMQQRWIKNWMNVSRPVVAQIMRDLDPVGVDARQRRALRRRLCYGKCPNRVCHLDGYDKFKPISFEVHGCIDGYSRCVLWLNILRSSKDLIIWLLLKEFHGKLH